MVISIKFFLLNGIYTARLVTARIQVVQILNKTMLGKGDSECVHSMVTMVVPLCPFLDTTNSSPVLVGPFLCQPPHGIFVPIQFLHDIHQLPVFAQTVGHST